MAKDKIIRYAWLIETIKRHGRGISFSEISSAWSRSSINDRDKELSIRTFQEHKRSINELAIGIQIVCDKTDDTYHIELDQGGNCDVAKWLWSAMSLKLAYEQSATLKDRIIFEEVPSSEVYLESMIYAIRESLAIKISYLPFESKEPFDIKLKPYLLRVLKKRWYVHGPRDGEDKVKLFALDRFQSLEILNQAFELPEDFSAEKIIMDSSYDNIPYEDIVIRAYGIGIKKLRTLPLHISQVETKTEDGLSEFTYRLQADSNFYSSIMSHGKYLKLISPQRVRNKLAEKIAAMNKYYL